MSGNITLRCAFPRCGHTWTANRARWDTGLDDNCCPECEEPNPTEVSRGEPHLCRDYYGTLYIVIDDEGEPVTDYSTNLEEIRQHRDMARGCTNYRIAKVGFKALVPDDGSPVEIVDDPDPVARRIEWEQDADAEHEAHQDALRKRLREGL